MTTRREIRVGNKTIQVEVDRDVGPSHVLVWLESGKPKVIHRDQLKPVDGARRETL